MSTPSSIVIRHSTLEPAASCVVCGNDIPAGRGLTARYGERTLRFKCPGCLARFEADPERYLAGDLGGCCGGQHTGGKHGPVGGTAQRGTAHNDPARDDDPRAYASPFSEWTCY